MDQISFYNLALVAAVAFVVPLMLGLFPRLRIPSVVLEILAGVILGPAVLGWIEMDMPVRVMALLGMAALLFLAGLEIEFEHLGGTVLAPAVTGFVLSLAIAAALCYTLAALGFLPSPLFIAILLSASALGIVVPMLKDAGETATEFGQLVIVAMSIADFGTVILLSLLFSSQGSGITRVLMLLAALFGLALVIVLLLGRVGRWQRLSTALVKLQDTTAMIRVRGAAFLVMAFVALSERFGLELILGAFVAGALLSLADRDQLRTHPQFRGKLQAVGFGIFIPVFFIGSGLQFNLGALLSAPTALSGVPIFLVALLLVRGLPAALYRRTLGTRRTLAAALLQATSLSFIVAGARIGVELGRIDEGTAAALVAAAMLSVLLFPSLALAILAAPNTQVASAAGPRAG